MPEASDSRFIPIADAAAYLSCSVKTIRRLIIGGKLRAYRLGKRAIRVDRTELDKVMTRIPHARISA